jgi:hypothetical protein
MHYNILKPNPKYQEAKTKTQNTLIKIGDTTAKVGLNLWSVSLLFLNILETHR